MRLNTEELFQKVVNLSHACEMLAVEVAHLRDEVALLQVVGIPIESRVTVEESLQAEKDHAKKIAENDIVYKTED